MIVTVAATVIVAAGCFFPAEVGDFFDMDFGPSPASETFAMGSYAASVEWQEKAVGKAIERGHSNARIARELSSLAFYRLFARDFEGSLSASDRAVALEPGNILEYANEALALTCLGRAGEANALYEKYKGRTFAKSKVRWEEGALRLVAEMEKRGVVCLQMNSFKAALSQSGGRASSQVESLGVTTCNW